MVNKFPKKYFIKTSADRHRCKSIKMNSTTRSVIEDINWYQWVPYMTYNCHGQWYAPMIDNSTDKPLQLLDWQDLSHKIS